MKNISWQKGLFRIYAILAVASIGLFIFSIKLRHDSEEYCALCEKSLATLHDANIAYDNVKNSPTIRETVRNAVSSGNLWDDPFSENWPEDCTSFNSRSDYYKRYLLIKTAIDEPLPLTEANHLKAFHKAIIAMPLQGSLTYRSMRSKALRKSESMLFLAGSLVISPWLLHFLIRFTLIPVAKWIGAGFTSKK